MLAKLVEKIARAQLFKRLAAVVLIPRLVQKAFVNAQYKVVPERQVIVDQRATLLQDCELVEGVRVVQLWQLHRDSVNEVLREVAQVALRGLGLVAAPPDALVGQRPRATVLAVETGTTGHVQRADLSPVVAVCKLANVVAAGLPPCRWI